MRASLITWIGGVIVITALYTLGPVLWFNRAEPPILGMPPLYFWFVLIPLISPAILGAVYLIDRHYGGVGSHIGEER